jgi:hypothetical protein
LDRPDPAVDQALVELAKVGTVRDLEQAVRRYQLCADQEHPGGLGALDRRGIRVHRGVDGYSRVEITLEDSELDELLAAIRAATDHTTQPATAKPVDHSPHEHSTDNTVGEPVDDSPEDDSATPARGWQLAADALMDLVRAGLAHLDQPGTPGADRYLVHLLHHTDTAQTELPDGTPLTPTVASRIACDTSTVTHLLSPDGEPLALGRRNRQWNTAQHRAINIRDGGTCRFPGCTNHITDIHHLQHWNNGGHTNIDNGLLLCQRHHTLTHNGYHATGNANHDVTFHRPDGTTLGTTRPHTYALRR